MQAGNWVLSNANTYSGATTISGGTLNVGNGTSGSLGGSTSVSISGGSLVLGAGGSIGGNSIAISAGSMFIVPGGSLGNAPISVTGAGTFAILPGGGTVSVGGSGAGTSGATLSLASGGAISMIDGAIGTANLQQQASFSGPALTLNAANLNFELSSTGADRLNVTIGTVSVTGANSIGITPIGSGLTVGGNYTLISAPAGGLSAGGTFQFVGGSQTTYVPSGNSLYQLTLHNSSTAETVTVATGPAAPPVTANLYAWYNAGFGVTANGSNVVQSWTDLSGNGHNMVLNSGNPTFNATGFNSLPAVQLGSISGDSLISPNFSGGLSGSHNMTIFVVMTDTTAAGTESHPFQFGIQSPLQVLMVGKSRRSRGSRHRLRPKPPFVLQCLQQWIQQYHRIVPLHSRHAVERSVDFHGDQRNRVSTRNRLDERSAQYS